LFVFKNDQDFDLDYQQAEHVQPLALLCHESLHAMKHDKHELLHIFYLVIRPIFSLEFI